jgi:hypothetical protein
VPVLLVLGAFSLWRPQVELEASSALTGALVSMAAIAAAPDQQLALAVYLTVAGALVTTTSIVHESRRLLAWPGGLLLAAATWVRLEQIGVHTPEAYTLPSALALVAAGLWRLRRDQDSASLTYLAPGLTLATVPSLLAMLDDPASWRALLLGLACLALVLAGVTLRWSAPLVVGGAVGALLVLREVAPYAAVVPTWLVIGLSGTVLTVVGITWESRMRDVRRATHYLAALRFGPRGAGRRPAARAPHASARVSHPPGNRSADAEQRLHDLPRGVDARLDRADGDVEQVGDVGVLQLLDVTQQQRLDQRRMVGAEHLERLEEVQPAAGDHAGGARVRGRRELVGRELDRAALQAAVRRPGAVGGDRVQPRGEAAPAGEGVDPGRHQQQGVLSGLLGVLVVEEHPPADPAHARLDLHQERAQRLLVAVGRARGQGVQVGGVLRVVHVGASSESGH